MKIGIVSDIHSNYWALQAMLRQERNIDTWICLGDMVGLLPMVNETLDLIRKSHMVAILGDHERALLKGTPLPQSRSATQVLEMQKTMITAKNRIFLETLSEKKHVRIGTLRCVFVHSFDRSNASIEAIKWYCLHFGQTAAFVVFIVFSFLVKKYKVVIPIIRLKM